MEAFAARRVGSAAAVALVVAGALAARAPGVGAEPVDLLPDLVILATQQEDLQLEHEGQRTLLRLTTEIGNRGSGPLEVFPSPASLDCDGDGDPSNDRDASQRVFADSNATGLFERGADEVARERTFGCIQYHPAHDHWHVLDLASYELRREPGGSLAARSRKVGFCLTDTRPAFPGPGVSPTSTYPINPPGGVGCDSTSTLGISPGWADAYAFAVPGQDLDVTGIPRGHYCLTMRADPTGVLEELDDDNNVRRTRIAMRPAKLIIRKLDEPCRI
ncbi:MAG: hypothetical protein QOI10_463 [Solirubrobacterales bacterium]|jgi:hypothetical protein|nr:hypothetical protein [Solirubrobacterales bacterium]